MKEILEHPLLPEQAAFWWLGQAGYVIRAAGSTVVIDPYLSDSGAQGVPGFSRLYPPPVKPEALDADVYLITHNHLDHLDPETIRPYQRKRDTWFVAPHLAARELPSLGIPEDRIVVVGTGESRQLGSLQVTGVFALPTGADVLDTTGYWLRFANGRNIYHTSDTSFHPLVLKAAPRNPEVMLVPINGKWGNPGAEEAAEFALAVQPRFVAPNHYDTMPLNAEDPEVFRWFCTQKGLQEQCLIPERMQPFVW